MSRKQAVSRLRRRRARTPAGAPSRGPRRGPRRRRERRAGIAHRVLASAPSRALRGAVVEVFSIIREMVLLVAAVFFGLAERLGRLTLAAWRRLHPVLRAAWRAGVRLFYLLERELTPARGAALVTLGAALLLAASQFADYRGITIDRDSYAGVGRAAPAPSLGSPSAGSAHAWVGLPLAAIAIILTALAYARRPWAARLLGGVGLAVIAVSLLVDVPSGLDEGTAAIAYDQAQASLLGGFWAQLSAGAVLVSTAALLAVYRRIPHRRRHGRAERFSPPPSARLPGTRLSRSGT